MVIRRAGRAPGRFDERRRHRPYRAARPAWPGPLVGCAAASPVGPGRRPGNGAVGMSPGWLLDAFAGLMLAVAAVSAARLVAARPWRRAAAGTDSDAAHLPMAIAMAGMLAPGLSTLPDRVWEAIFGLLVVWF